MATEKSHTILKYSDKIAAKGRNLDKGFVCLQVKIILDCLMETQASFTDIGDSAPCVEHLLKELKLQEEKAQVNNINTTFKVYIPMKCSNPIANRNNIVFYTAE